MEYDFLLIEDLTDLLDSVKVLYEQTFWSDVPALIGTPHRREFGVQVVRADTSRSIVVELQALGQTVAGLDPSLTGIGGGIIALGLTARILIHAFKSGHEVLSAARMRSLEIQARRNEVAAVNLKAILQVGREEVSLEAVRRDADFRDFIQSALRATATADFAGALSRSEGATEVVGAALLNAWSILQNDNVTAAQINEEQVKSAPDGAAGAEEEVRQDPGLGDGTPRT